MGEDPVPDPPHTLLRGTVLQSLLVDTMFDVTFLQPFSMLWLKSILKPSQPCDYVSAVLLVRVID